MPIDILFDNGLRRPATSLLVGAVEIQSRGVPSKSAARGDRLLRNTVLCYIHFSTTAEIYYDLFIYSKSFVEISYDHLLVIYR